MKYVFVVNPTAGGRDSTLDIKEKLKAFPDEDIELFVSQRPGDTTSIVSNWLQGHPNTPVRFISCGGDGTLNETVNGVAGHPLAAIGCYPCGSGNDFVKYYGDKAYFLDLAELLNGEEMKIDLIKANDRYAINACHFGFDSAVARMIPKLKHKWYVGAKLAYPVAVGLALIRSMKSVCRLTVDGKPYHDGEFLLCTLANGTHVGGSYKCAPRSRDNDGLMEVCLVKPVSRLKFTDLMGLYQKGMHLDDPSFKKVICYTRAKQATLDSDKDFPVALDGEVINVRHLDISVVEKALNFIVPISLVTRYPTMGNSEF